MLGSAEVILLCLLLSEVNGLITTDAKCLSGYEWMFSTINQSPCDVAAELASVCVGGEFNLPPIPAGFVYGGPTPQEANDCRCSSVYYSLLSACAYCQGANYLSWSVYDLNCTTVFVTVYNEQIPVGVKVPAYAYQNVSISDSFNVALAQSINGPESSRVPSSPTSTSSSSSLATSSSSSSVNNTPAIVGGVVGGVLGLGIIVAIVIFLVLRSKREPKWDNYNASIQLSDMASSKDPSSPIPSTSSPTGQNAHGQRLSSYTYPNIFDPHGQHSPPLNQPALTNYTGNSVQKTQLPQYTGGSGTYTGMPEV